MHLSRQVKAALTFASPAPPLRRRRREETRRSFTPSATSIMRRTVRIPAAAYAAAYLWDTLDWLNPWHQDVSSAGEMDDDCQPADQNHLSLHL